MMNGKDLDNMATNWTPEQTNAIEVSGKAAVVSAAAGSGKTAVLVEKLLRMLSDSTDRVSADRIVVVTFTNDAAAQMKQRLCAKLAEAAEADPGNDWLITQQSLIPSAKISTIHSFCFDLIRQNAALLDVDPGFRVLDSSEADSVEAQAAKNVIGSRFSMRADDMAELTRLFCPDSQSEDKLLEIISHLREKFLALPFPADIMDKIIKMYRDGADELKTVIDFASSADDIKKAKDKLMSDPLVGRYVENANARLLKQFDMHIRAANDMIAEYSNMLNNIPSNWCKPGAAPKDDFKDTRETKDKLNKLISDLNSEIRLITHYINILNSNKFRVFSLLKAAMPYTSPRFNKFKLKYIPQDETKSVDKTINANGAVFSRMKACQSATKAAITKLTNSFSLPSILRDYSLHEKMCSLLFELIKDILLEEAKLKSEKNALTFSDAEQLAVELLCKKAPDGSVSKTALAEELSDYFRIVMIDEFQDSTAVQELIFRMLSKGGTADAPGSNFFAVGDVKQSIYRFRCSDPTLFLDNLKASSDYVKGGSEKRAKIYLNRNFRSSHGVVEFVNAVFRAVMSEENGGVVYDKNAELAEGAGIGDIYGPTELIELPCSSEINKRSDDPDSSDNQNTAADDAGRKDTADSAAKTDASDDSDDEETVTSLDIIEARCAAIRIKQLLEKEKITENGEERAVRPSDICILMRNTKKAGIFIGCLEELGISAQGSAAESYLGSREISILINLLRCIDNVTLDIPMTSVLMSPMFMFTAEDIARLRTDHLSSVYNDILLASQGKKNVPEALKEKCAGFIRTFGRLRDHAACHTVSELIGLIYSKTDFMAVVSVYSDSLKKKANLRLLPILAEKFGENGSGSLNSFLRAVDVMLRNGKDFESASTARSISESVEIKTIHKSKGLEYPFVFLCQTHVKFNLSDCYKQSVFASVPGGCSTGFRIFEPQSYSRFESFPRNVLSDILRMSQRDEEMMLLYVALTRAKCKLFITRRHENEPMSKRDKSTVGMKRKQLAELISFNNNIPDCTAAVSAAMTMAEWLDIALSLFGDNNGVLTCGSCEAVVSKGTAAPDSTDADSTRKIAEPSEERAVIFRRNISYDYDDTLSVTASKLTVSEIAKKHDFKPQHFFAEEAPKKQSKKQPAGISAADRGTAVHGFMQYGNIAALAALSPEDRLTAIPAEAERLCRKGYLTELQASCADPEVIGKFLDSELCGRIVRSGNVMKERKFLVKIADLCIDEEILDNSGLRVYNNTEGMLQGVADLLFEEDDKLILVDYKTDRNVTPEVLKERYSMQLYLYAKALSLILGKPVAEAYLYSFELGTAVRTELSPENIIL
ncbi:MAG: UvrD-helicase domain-containing protein [Oscillospiraceae bacterium]|nr:UvrD-helicase domain-containing protein [Oscillospiraceae bacterium]